LVSFLDNKDQALENGNFYDKEVEGAMIVFYNHLNERDRRHFSAISTMQLPHGGKKYISSILNIDTRTIYEGKAEIKNNNIVTDGIRKKGAGRKSIEELRPDIDEIFLKVLKDHTAGDPMNKKIVYTDLTKKEIVLKLKGNNIEVSKKFISKLLKKHGYVKRKIQKKKNKRYSLQE
jgi:hypothetical protein